MISKETVWQFDLGLRQDLFDASSFDAIRLRLWFFGPSPATNLKMDQGCF